MQAIKFKLELNQHTIKKMVLESFLTKTEVTNIDNYEGYFYLDSLGDPVFVVETKD